MTHKSWMTEAPGWIGSEFPNVEVIRKADYNELRDLVLKYLGEYDNPSPDLMLRRKYRDQLRRAVNGGVTGG